MRALQARAHVSTANENTIDLGVVAHLTRVVVVSIAVVVVVVVVRGSGRIGGVGIAHVDVSVRVCIVVVAAVDWWGGGVIEG